MDIGARPQVWIHVRMLPAAFAKPARVLRGWHPHPSRGHPASRLGMGHPTSAPHLLPSQGSPAASGFICLGKGRGSAASALGNVCELPCSRLGGLDLSSPVRSISSPGSSRHRRCRVLADVSRAARGRGAAAVGLSIRFPVPPVLQHPPHRLPRGQRARGQRVRLFHLTRPCLSFPI